MSKERIIYDFCPKCGALSKNGICTYCGHDSAVKEQETKPADGLSANVKPEREYSEEVQSDEGGSVWQQPQQIPGKKHTGLIVGLCVGAAVFAFLLFLAVAMIISGAQDAAGRIENPFLGLFENLNPEDDAETADMIEEDADQAEADYTVFDSKTSDYLPSAEDEYYLEIVDAVREDLPYQINWVEFDVANEKEEITSKGIYPQLTGDIPNLDSLNASIEEEALYYKNALEEYGMQSEHDSAGSETACYVTYMDENILSIVYQESLTLGMYRAPELHSLNIDVKSGRLIEKEELLEYSSQLAARVKKQNIKQNSGVDFISEMEDDEILELLSGYEGVIFCTPVGIELGFNYELNGYVGWVTVTLKDYAAYGNKF